jgi:predicted permease
MMAAIRRFVFRLVQTVSPHRADARLDREIAAHLELLEERFRQQGLSPAEARLAARRRFGGIDQTREIARDARSFRWLDDLRRDGRYAARALARTPAFTAAAVLTLAIGIGGTTAVVSLIDAVLVRPLPYRDPHRLVMVFEDNSGSGFPQDVVGPLTYGAWAAENDVFESIAAATDFGAVLTGHGEPTRIEARRVTRSFFGVLGAEPLLGRIFTEREDRPGGARVALLSHGLWQRAFGGDTSIVGRDIILNNERHVVIGVMPRGFQFLESYVGLWLPAAFTSEELTNRARYITVAGRMKPGVDRARVHANLETISRRAAERRSRDDTWSFTRPVVVPVGDEIVGAARRPLVLLLAAVGAVLLITCANLASLLVARAASRRHEIALRGALGASRNRVIRQLLTESLLLAGMGLAAGSVLARWSFGFLEQLVPPGMTLFAQPELDGRALAAAAVIALGTGLLFGLVPALDVTRPALGDVLKANARTVPGSGRRSGLVVFEVAMTLVLLVAAGLLLDTFYRLRYTDLGMRPEHVLTLRTPLFPQERYQDPVRRRAFYDRVLESVDRLPGVVAAGYTTSVPLEWKGGTSEFCIEGKPADPAVPQDANHRQVSASYLRAIGTPLRRGRHFDIRDTERSQPVVIVNEMMARRYWPGEDVIGRRMAIDRSCDEQRWLTIVGVVADVRQMGLDAPPRPEMYILFQQIDTQPWFAPRDLVVRTSGPPEEMVRAVKEQIHAADPTLAISNVRTLDEVLDEDVAARRVGTTVLLAFAATALLLAFVGIYGVIAYFVAQHIPEMGVRIALGAQARDILQFLVVKGARLALAGVAIGTFAALATARLMASLLHGVSGAGLTICALAGAAMVVLAVAASYLPARRAVSVDPIVALRAE